jgi:hypothetical protein
MNRIGFSTGALALSDFRLALRMLQNTPCDAIELSALRQAELEPLIEAADSLDLHRFASVSFHAPSKIDTAFERKAVELLDRAAAKQWTIVAHPDAISNYSLWKHFGELLAIENMDKRKPIGRYVSELIPLFERLPDAGFCFDIGHARQIDPSMAEAGSILREFQTRLKLLHISEVNTESKHDPLSLSAVLAFKKVTHLIPDNLSVIVESRVTEDQIAAEIEAVLDLFQASERELLAGD